MLLKVYKLQFLGSGGEVREVNCPDDMYIFDAAGKALSPCVWASCCSALLAQASLPLPSPPATPSLHLP